MMGMGHSRSRAIPRVQTTHNPGYMVKGEDSEDSVDTLGSDLDRKPPKLKLRQTSEDARMKFYSPGSDDGIECVIDQEGSIKLLHLPCTAIWIERYPGQQIDPIERDGNKFTYRPGTSFMIGNREWVVYVCVTESYAQVDIKSQTKGSFEHEEFVTQEMINPFYIKGDTMELDLLNAMVVTNHQKLLCGVDCTVMNMITPISRTTWITKAIPPEEYVPCPDITLRRIISPLIPNWLRIVEYTIDDDADNVVRVGFSNGVYAKICVDDIRKDDTISITFSRNGTFIKKKTIYFSQIASLAYKILYPEAAYIYQGKDQVFAITKEMIPYADGRPVLTYKKGRFTLNVNRKPQFRYWYKWGAPKKAKTAVANLFI